MKQIAIALTTFLLSMSALGHHSDAALDTETTVTIDGTISEFNWRNPHVYFTVATQDEAGNPVEWTVQMASSITVSRMGWSRDSLTPGDRVTVSTYPARDGRPYGLLAAIEKDDGTSLRAVRDPDADRLNLAGPDSGDVASSLQGRWMADIDSLVGYRGGLDGLTRTELRLTEEATAAAASYDENSAENPELNCIGRPTPALIVYTNLYPMEIEFRDENETIIIRSQFFDEERTVYMDGRQHPRANELFHEGHSIGWWEDDVLVVDTTNFTPHRSPYQNGIPSGTQKHVVERYELTADGRRIQAEFMLEDPEFISEPMTHRRALLFSPQMSMAAFDCDIEATRRFRP
jgi:hypothetical protein